MKLSTLFIGMTSVCCMTAFADQAMQDTAEAKGLIKQFGGTLKGELQTAMKAGGPVNAIEVCNTKAPGIARDLSHSSGWDIARTSLKTRNPTNSPDAWELSVLEKFEERKAAGENPEAIDYAEVTELNGQKTFRYMKAIPTGEVCLNCHGAEIKPEVEKKLGMLYPEDKARGYSLGDIRGAFTLSKPL
jgi:hypothetical protein